MAVVYFLYFLRNILKSKKEKIVKRKKTILLLPMPMFSIVLIYMFFLMLRFRGIIIFYGGISTIPIIISFWCTLLFTNKLLKENMSIKDWYTKYKIIYIIICIVAILGFIFIMAAIISDLIVRVGI